MAPPEVRPAEPRDDDAVARLLYESASGRYDIFCGGRERALRLLAVTIGQPGNDTSRDGVVVAELDGALAGAMASFPARDGAARRRQWLRLALRRRSPWHWRGMLKVASMGEQLPVEPPADALYIDALSTDARFRRRGVARALLEAADRRARALGLARVALDTGAGNAAARGLYESAGFEMLQETEPVGPIPPIVVYVREVA